MFEHITRGPGARRPGRSPSAVAVSAVLHLALIGGLAALPRPAAVERGPSELVSFMDLPDFSATMAARERTPAPAAPAASRVDRSGPGAEAPTRPLEPAHTGDAGPVRRPKAAPSASPDAPPLDAPDGLPELRPEALAASIGGIGADEATIVTVATGLLASPGRDGKGSARSGGEAGEPVPAVALAEPPSVQNPAEVQRLLSQIYPEQLQSDGIEGEVLLAFVVGTDGRVEMESIKVIQFTHADFIEPALEGARRLRFNRARLNGEPVRVTVALPLHWTLPA